MGDPLSEWKAAGSMLSLAGHDVFVVDTGEPGGDREPVLLLHGFPTSSFDYEDLVQRLAPGRRVVTLDFLGFGLSAKPDLNYTIGLQADLVVALTAALGLERAALVTHDMGDTIGGELLARQAEGTWPIEITRRVVTNGSIYIEDAQLTDGQQFLLALPDQRLDIGPERHGLAASLHATLSPGTTLTVDDLLPHADLVREHDGERNLPRLIRYIEERRANERRFTGAIEAHPSPLWVVWGSDDPIAVLGMTATLRAARPDLQLTVLEGVGHYPMLEDPVRFGAAVESALG